MMIDIPVYDKCQLTGKIDKSNEETQDGARNDPLRKTISPSSQPHWLREGSLEQEGIWERRHLL